MRALLSVYEKTGIVEFGRALAGLGWELVSTGGTSIALAEAGLPVTSIADVTGFPEILDGRVKTLHPSVHGGLLGRLDLATDVEQLSAHDILPIGLLVSNLYPFEQTVQTAGVSRDEVIENIDIGGPAMLRAAAKNHQYVLTVTEPSDYGRMIDLLKSNAITQEIRQACAAKAFAHTSAYDSLVAGYLHSGSEQTWPDVFSIAGRKSVDLRYGENPHQSAAAYSSVSLQTHQGGLLDAKQLQGKQLSYNNLLDGDAAWNAVLGWKSPTVSIVKHTIPCGLAQSDDLAQAFAGALSGDPVSAFGGIVASNREIDLPTAEAISEIFFEIVLAPSFSAEALAVLGKKKNMRLLEMGEADALTSRTTEVDIRSITGGFLVQTADSALDDEPSGWEVKTERHPTEKELHDLTFAWRVCALVKSNAIVLAKDSAVLGVGSGQPNRLESVAIAARKAGDRSVGSVLASDAFFPFADGLKAAIEAGATAVIQPGGSMRDKEVIEAANSAGIAMVFTGQRHFRH